MLTDEQIERYSRQIILPQVGGKGQEKLLRSRVLVNAAPPLQTSVLHYLAAAGVGVLGVVAQVPDPLLTSLSSPQTPNPLDIFTKLNSDCTARLHSNVEARASQHLVQSYDIILADSDLLHDASYVERRPFLYAAAQDHEAALLVCRGYEPLAPCFRCAPPLLSPSAPLPSEFSEIVALFMGAHLATEAIKQLLNLSLSSGGSWLCFRFPDFEITEKIITKSPDCRLCRPARF